MVCLSYRGYWRSRGRPSERGIGLDAEAALQWVRQLNSDNSREKRLVVVLWGQSIGAGVATNLAVSSSARAGPRPDVLILETPFLSVPAMLEVLYPQKWLPYRHLWPFLRNHLDTEKNLEVVAADCEKSGLRAPGRDELVPAEHAAKLYQRCLELDLPVEKGRGARGVPQRGDGERRGPKGSC